MKSILLALGSVALFVVANTLATQFGETRRIGVLVACGIAATTAMALFGFLSAARGLAAMSAVVDVLIVVGTVLVGILLRGERLTIVQTMGVLLGIAATLMILLGGAAVAKEVP